MVRSQQQQQRKGSIVDSPQSQKPDAFFSRSSVFEKVTAEPPDPIRSPKAVANWSRIYHKGRTIVAHQQHRRRSLVERATRLTQSASSRYAFDGEVLRVSSISMAAETIADVMEVSDLNNKATRVYAGVLYIVLLASISSMILQTLANMPVNPDLWFYIDLVTTLFFCAELIVQCCVSPSPSEFMRDPMTIINIMAILSFLFDCLPDYLHDQVDAVIPMTVVLSIFKIMRVIRLLRAARTSMSYQMVIRVFENSIQAFSMVVFMILILVTFLASTILFTDGSAHGAGGQAKSPHADSMPYDFTIVPNGLYWAVSTVCTVGYGDLVPTSPMGKLLGGLAAASGILVLSIPVVHIISFNFFR